MAYLNTIGITRTSTDDVTALGMVGTLECSPFEFFESMDPACIRSMILVCGNPLPPSFSFCKGTFCPPLPTQSVFPETQNLDQSKSLTAVAKSKRRNVVR